MTGRNPVRIEQRTKVRVDPERVFEIICDPTQVSHYAARIEGATVLEHGPDGGLVGSKIELITTGGNTVAATVTESDPPHSITMEDENGLRSTWRVEKDGDHSVIVNVLEGPLNQEQARKLAYDADVKFQALARSLESPGKSVPEGEGLSDIVGTPKGAGKGG